MLLLNWNIEWMNRWFTGNNNPVWGSTKLDPDKAQIAAKRAANVIRNINPDIVCIQEGPSAIQEMQLFINEYLSDDGTPLYWPLMGKASGSQKLYALIKSDGEVEDIDYRTDELTEGLEEQWQADVDGDMMLQPYDFTRLPMVVDVNPKVGDPFRIVVVHTKSKHVHKGKALFNDPATRQQFIAAALKARRRISAEGFRLRSYLDELILDNPSERVIVVGDFNDGPGKDFFERSYLTHNVADIVLGSTFYPDLIFRNPILDRMDSAKLFTARFDDYVDNVQDRPLLLDHIALSPALNANVIDAKIEHEAFEAEIEGTGDLRWERASDHRPISVSFT